MLENASHLTSWVLLAGLVGMTGSLGARLLRRFAHRDTCEHIVRLAGAVTDIEKTIEADLARAGASALFPKFQVQSRDYAKRANNALAAREQLRSRRADVLHALLMLLHEDHRRMVELRSELDTVLAIWAHSHGPRLSTVTTGPGDPPAGYRSSCA